MTKSKPLLNRNAHSSTWRAFEIRLQIKDFIDHIITWPSLASLTSQFLAMGYQERCPSTGELFILTFGMHGDWRTRMYTVLYVFSIFALWCLNNFWLTHGTAILRMQADGICMSAKTFLFTDMRTPSACIYPDMKRSHSHKPWLHTFLFTINILMLQQPFIVQHHYSS